MKRSIIALILMICATTSNAQTLGGYAINDYLVSAVHPNGCTDEYITGPPSDSIWVNMDVTDSIMTGNFGQLWTDVSGTELLLETGYHGDNLSIRLLLSSGLYSASYNVLDTDWTLIELITWQFVNDFDCIEGTSVNRDRFILPLDFDQDFGLTPSDEVQGIEITFLFTDGVPDLAGVYITDPTVSVNSYSLDEISIYPNPFSEELIIKSTRPGGLLRLNLIDVFGAVVYSREFQDTMVDPIIIDPDIPDGMYILELVDDKGAQFHKVLRTQLK